MAPLTRTTILERRIPLPPSRTHILVTRAESSFSSTFTPPFNLGLASPGVGSSTSLAPVVTNVGGNGRTPHTAGAEWHNAHVPSSLKHLSIWAYIAFGFLVVSVSMVVSYTCFRCCRANIVRIETDGSEEVKQERGDGVKKGRKERFGWYSRRNSTTTSSEVKAFGKNPASFGRIESTIGENSWVSNMTADTTMPGYGGPIFVQDPSGLGGYNPTKPDLKFFWSSDFGARDKTMSPTGKKVDTSTGQSLSNAAHFDSFNIPFAGPKNSGSMTDLWQEPKLSPIGGSIIRPEPAVTVVSRRWL